VQIRISTASQDWTGATWTNTVPTWITVPGGLSSWVYTSTPPWQTGMSYTISAKSVDVAGNTSSVASYGFIYDLNAPAATVTSPVVGSNGAVIPAGSSVVLDVASVAPDGSSIGLRVVSVDFNGMTYPVSGQVATQSPLERSKIEGDPNGDKKKVIGGAIAGAIIGQMIGHNTKGTVIGAATGAAGGAVAAKAMEKYESCLPVGGTMRLTLDSPIVL